MKKLLFLLIIPVLLILPACTSLSGGEDYSYTLEIIKLPEQWYAGEWNGLRVRVSNTGVIPWVVSEGNLEWRVRLSYHLMDPKGETILTEGIRTDFSDTVRPGQSVDLMMNIYLPEEPAKFKIKIDLLKESLFWLSDKGNKPTYLDIESVTPLIKHQKLILEKNKLASLIQNFIKQKDDNSGKPYLRLYTEHSSINEAMVLIARCFEKNFRENELITGFAAGSIYPQVWLRDSYYHFMGAHYFYSLENERKMLESFLEVYATVGKVPDYIGFNGEKKFYTVASDGPPFLLLLASDYLKRSGNYDWLKNRLNGRTVFSILMDLLLKEFPLHFSKQAGLYFSGHTADWGDVEDEDEGEDALFLSYNSHRVAGIYTQSLYYCALRKWADVLFATHLYQDAMITRFQSDKLDLETNLSLWDAVRGYYRIHKHLSPLTHDFNEDNIFALGGNIWACRSGIAQSDQVNQILAWISEVQRSNNYPTISKVLIPPYPQGFFSHPSLRDENQYQNGGFWDWYGGLVVREEFRAGNFLKAIKHLNEITELISSSKNLYEWYDEKGIGHGSIHYLASGAVITEALMEGYFGITHENGNWVISPSYDEKTRAITYINREIGLKIAYKIKPIGGKNIEIEYYTESGEDIEWRIPLKRVEKEEVSKIRKSRQYYYDPESSYLYYTFTAGDGYGKSSIDIP